MKKVSDGLVVACPKCGMPAGVVTTVSMQRYFCSNKTCSTKFTGWVVNGFVITFLTQEDESVNNLNGFDACKDKLKQMAALC